MNRIHRNCYSNISICTEITFHIYIHFIKAVTRATWR